MNEEILNFIKNLVSPETADTYEAAFAVFERVNVTDYILPFNDLFAMADNTPSLELMDDMEQCLETMLTSILKQHGIFLSDEAQAAQLVDFCNAVMDLQEHEDLSTVLSIADTDVSPEDQLAQMLHLVQPKYAIEEYMAQFESVTPSLIKKIASLFHERQQVEDNVYVDPVNMKERVAAIKLLYEDVSGSLVYPKILEGLRFNLSFDFYFKTFWNHLTVMPIPTQARDLVAMTYLSSDANDKTLETVQQYLGQYVSDLDALKRTLDLVSRYFLGSKVDGGITRLPNQTEPA